MIGGVQKQFNYPTAKYVEVREVECVNGSKIDRLFSFCYLLSGLDSNSIFLFVNFATDLSPHGASIIEVFENAEVPSDTCPGQFDSVTSQRTESVG